MRKQSFLAKLSNRYAITWMVLLFLAGIGFLFLPRLFSRFESIAEAYSRRVFPILSFVPSLITNLFPISNTEVLVVCSGFILLIMLISFILRMALSENRLRTLRNVFLFLSVAFFILASQYTMMHGMNYSRLPIRRTLMLESEDDYNAQEIEQAMNFYLDGIISAQAELDHNDRGETLLLTSISSTLRAGNDSMNNAASLHPVFSGNDVVPKPVKLSKYWSYTRIVGMYNPFFVEANINVSTPAYEIPLVVCHEIAHVRGIAREDEANMTSFIACLLSDRADYRYAANLYAFENLIADMQHYDSETCDDLISRLPEAVFADWKASADYWSQFEGKVSEISNNVNDTFLKANQQQDGVQSYNLNGRIFLDYYYLYLVNPS
ncbi:MAG: DUF3810 domain-containing protein [Clostridiaceae bacterium]|nr:DUF3810 domain-containing protein [Clostridiaceae bacterium]